MDINPLRNNLCTITDIVLRRDNRHGNNTTDTTRHDTTQNTRRRHITFPLNTSPPPAQIQAHFIPSDTRLAQEYSDNCFLHDANMFAQQGMSQGKCSLALRASQSRVLHSANWDERSLSSSLRTEGGEPTGVREKEGRAEREYDKREETYNKNDERETDRNTVCPRRSRAYFQNSSVCTVKTRCHIRHGRFDGTHGSVLNVHTALFVECKNKEEKPQREERNAHTLHSTIQPQQRAQPNHNTSHNTHRHSHTHITHHTLPLSLRREGRARDF